MTDPRALADDAVLHLDRLGAVILDDVGDGPPPADLFTAASAAHEAVARLAIPALTQLTALVSGVAESLVGGATEWNPSLGGTLMAAVDDLRHLVARPARFTDEDSEHLHHRAAELSAYVHASVEQKPVASEPAVIPSEPAVIPSEAKDLLGNRQQKADPSPSAQHDKASAQHDKAIVPISQLFYADAGPHIVSGGVTGAASNRSDLLGRGIDALDILTARPLATPSHAGPSAIVPVETLVYRGRAALQRAADIREQIKTSGGVASPAALDEMYDLIGLALKD